MCGVGGSTIEEAQATVSQSEFHAWLAYRSKHGPLNQSLRLERGLAQVCYMIAATSGSKKEGGGKWSVDDFLPYHEPPDLEIGTAMAKLGVKKNG